MKMIFDIYKRDIRNIFTNWVALLVIVALMFLPSLYAWFNIKASWDPYSNTSGILVAVVNNDQGAVLDGKEVNIGNKLTDELKKNESIGWTFVTKEEADRGVKNATYYASVTIPEDFSRNVASITEREHQKAEIIYTVNEKKNAVAPKITKSGVTAIQQQVTSNIVETADYLIFDIFNKVSMEITENLPQIKSLIQIIYEVDQKIPEINKTVDEAYNGAFTLQKIVKQTQDNMPLIKDTVNKASQAAETGGVFLEQVKGALTNVNPYVKESLTSLMTTAQITDSIINNAILLLESNPAESRELLESATRRLNDEQTTMSHLLEYLYSLENISTTKTLSPAVDHLLTQQTSLQSLYESTTAITNNPDQPLSLELLTKLKNDSAASVQLLETLIGDYDSTIAPSVGQTVNDVMTVVNQTNQLLQDAASDIPKLEALLNTATSTVNTGIQDIEKLKKDLPLIESAIQSTAQKLKALDEDQQLTEMLELLKLDAKKEAEFLAAPVDIKQISMYEIPNYGSAMSPFFTTLSLWVGALILVSLLSVNAVPFSEQIDKKGIRLAFIGRFLTFVTIAIFQALIVTLGDIFLLKAYVVNKAAFILFAIFISIVFCMIVYTLVSVFGNAGKALAMILLVLQISASGGTFPIEVMPNFFQAIHPVLPFTYAIGGMRETVGGIIWDILWRNAAILLIYFIAFFIIGMVWKAPMRARVTKFTEKLKKSGLVEE
jgi:putative membrane protein